MKTNSTLVPLLALSLTVAAAQSKDAQPDRTRSDAASRRTPQALRTYSSLDHPDTWVGLESLPRGALHLEDANLEQVLKLYQELSGRTVIAPATLPKIELNLRNETPVTRPQALQLMDTALAQQGITMVLMGAHSVKAVPSELAPMEAPPLIDYPPDELPQSSSYLMYIAQLKHADPTELVPALQPLASKLPNSIMAMKTERLLVLRDYAANVRQMLDLAHRLDKPQPKAAALQPSAHAVQCLQKVVRRDRSQNRKVELAKPDAKPARVK